MARLKSRYRKYSTGGAVPEVEIKIAPDNPDGAQLAAEEAVASLPPVSDPDGVAAVKDQMAALKHAGAHQRAQRQPQDAVGAAISQWRAAGTITEPEAEFLRSNPDLVEFSQLTQIAASEAIHAGVAQGSPEYFQAIRTNFDRHMGNIRANAGGQSAPAKPAAARPSAATSLATMAETESDYDEGRAAMVSAPVSRNPPSWSGSYEKPGRVTLSPAEREAALMSGISEVDYARNKIKMMQAKQRGDIQS